MPDPNKMGDQCEMMGFNNDSYKYVVDFFYCEFNVQNKSSGEKVHFINNKKILTSKKRS